MGSLRTRSSGWRGRAVAAVSAALYLAGLLLTLGHQAEVTHLTCAEHGEPVHLAATVGPATPSTEEARLGPGELAAALHDHDHCAVAATSRVGRPAAGLGARLLAVAPRRRALPSPVVTAVVQPPLLFRLAPKTSPPV